MKPRKILAILLAVLMLAGLVPVSALAGECPSPNSAANGGNHGWRQTGSTEPTCTAPGYKNYTCIYCGTTKREPNGSALGHNFGGWTASKNATCTAGGEEVRTCSRCGASETRSTAALGHSFGSWSTSRAATCTADGEEVRTCSRCGVKETRSTPMVDHTWGKWKTTRKATCDRKGVEERKCSVCGKKKTRDIDRLPHTYGDWTVTRESTCSEKGERTRTCEKCGHVDVQAIDTLPHTYGDWTVTLEPTCTQEGARTHTCQICGFEEGEAVEKAPHDFGDWTVTLEPTCTEEGSQTHACAACGLEETEAVPRKGHRFGEWTVVAEMTDFSIGVRERACERCGELERQEQEPQPTYRKGDRGDGVKDLQGALNAGGFNCGAADGIFGNKTEAAVKAVEQAHDFEPDGIAWPGVQKWLGMVGGMGPGDDPLPGDINSTFGGGNPTVPVFEDAGEVFSARRFVVTDIPDWDSAFYDGADVKVQLRLTIDNYSSYRLEGFGLGYADDAFANEWSLIGMTLSAGESYDFTYHMHIKEAPESWNKRAATVYLRNQRTGMLEQETVEFGPTWRPAKISLGHESGTSKPTLILSVDKNDYVSRVYAGDTIDIPIRVGIEGPELAEVRNLMLTIKQVNTDHNEVFKTDEFKLKNKYMGTDADFGYLAQVMATIPVPTYIEPRALRLQLSGTYTAKKGKSKVVESEVVSLAYNPSIKDKESPGISLDYYVTPWKNLYGPGDRVTVHMTVKNVGPEPVEIFGMRFIGPNKEILSKLDDIQDVPAQTILTTGATADASWSYTIQKEDCDAASMEADVHVRGMLLKDGRTIITPSIHVSIPCREILPEFLSLTAQVQEERPLYTPGMTVPVRLTLSDTTNRRLTRTRIYATGDNQKSGILNDRIWHDFGHGASGFMIGDMGPIDYKYKTMLIGVTIPEDFTGDAFRASWVAEGDYPAEYRSARSNTATVQLPIMQTSDEATELSLNVELRSICPHEDGIWRGDDVVDVKLSADYLGSSPAKRLIIEGADTTGKQPITLSAENTDQVSDTVQLTLDKGQMTGGTQTFVFRALANVKDADTTDYMTANHTLVFDFTPQGKGEVVVTATILSECPNEDGKWRSGDNALVRVEASYDGPVMPPRRIDYSAYAPGNTESAVAHSEIWYADTIADEFTVHLDSHDAVNDKIVYTIAAYVCEGESGIYTCDNSTQLIFEMSPTGTGPDADGPSAGGMGTDAEELPAFVHPDSIYIDTGHTPAWMAEAIAAQGESEDETTESPAESGAGGEVTEVPAESGAGGEVAEAPAESGAGGEATESPAESGAGGEAVESPAESGAGGEAVESPAESGAGGEAVESPAESGAGGEAVESPAESGAGSEAVESPAESGAGGEATESPAESGAGGEATESPAESGAGGEATESPAESGAGGEIDEFSDEGGEGNAIEAAESTCTETVVSIAGADYDIPATICLPQGDGPFPAVVMLHGTGSTRDEAGDGYRFAAPVLAEVYGIATIRIDFPGNGDSAADYMQYNFHSAVADAKAAADYMASLDCIDGNAIGVMGWSQGGTDALLACAWEPETFKALVTWAGAPDMMLDDFFTEADYAEARANGYFVMEFDWRESLNVSLQWCDDVANTDVLREFSEGFMGPVLAIAGTEDDTVDPRWSRMIVDASGNPMSRAYFIEGMDHTFNVFSEEDQHSLRQAVDATGAFFLRTLGTYLAAN